MIRLMAKKKGDNSAGKITRFPYSILWEEFAPSWESLSFSKIDLEIFEIRFAAAKRMGGAPHLTIVRDQLHTVVEPLGLAPELRARLVEQLYGLAGHYLAPQHRKLFRTSPASTHKQMRVLARAAANFAKAMAQIPADAQVVLDVLRPFADNPLRSDENFSFESLEIDSRDLAKAATLFADEMPLNPRGTSVDVLRQRWISSTVTSIEEASGHRVEVRQMDSAGRNPRHLGTTGEVLLAYCRMVSPQILPRTIVRLILAQRSRSEASQAT